MTLLESNYKRACEEISDINEHIPTLKRYADLCNHITEFGVRSAVSTWAWVMSNAKTIRCYDVSGDTTGAHKIEADKLGKDFVFKQQDVIADVFEIDPTDLLFIDTDHTYIQCSKELKKHSSKVSKFIVLHDTVTFGAELNKAVEEFLDKNHEWMLREACLNNNGLTVLARKD